MARTASETKQIHTAPLPFAGIANWLVAPVKLALLNLAIDLELPDIVSRTHDLPGIAARLGDVRQDRLAYVLDALVAAEVLQKNAGGYYNAAFAADFLRKTEAAYLGDLVRSLQGMQLRNVAHFKDLLFGAQPTLPEEHVLHGEEHWRRAMRGLAGYQKAGAADVLAEVIAALPGADGFRKLLDLGCGPGIISLRTLQRLPQLNAVLCDFPRTLQLAREEAEAAGMAGRISCIPGDYNSVEFGTDFDVLWACQSLYYVRDLAEFMQKIAAALRPGGFFVSVHEGVCCEATAPSLLVLSRLSLAMEGQDVSFDKGAIAEAAASAGLVRTRASVLNLLYGAVDCEVFQKPEAQGGER